MRSNSSAAGRPDFFVFWADAKRPAWRTCRISFVIKLLHGLSGRNLLGLLAESIKLEVGSCMRLPLAAAWQPSALARPPALLRPLLAAHLICRVLALCSLTSAQGRLLQASRILRNVGWEMVFAGFCQDTMSRDAPYLLHTGEAPGRREVVRRQNCSSHVPVILPGVKGHLSLRKAPKALLTIAKTLLRL